MTAVSVSGVASTPVGKLPGRSTMDLAVTASLAALADSGLELDQVDGLLTTPPLVGAFARQAPVLAEHLDVAEQLTWCGTVSQGGASSLNALVQAVDLVASGRCRVVLFVAADTPRTGQERSASVGAFAQMRHPDWEQPYGLTNAAAYALLARRYLHRHGLGDDALASIPVAMRAHAAGQSDAVYRDALTEEDVLASRMIAEPLRLLECSPISDGAGALVVSRGGDGPRVIASGQGYRYDSVSFGRDLARTGAGLAGARAFAESGLSVSDMDVALLYDSYSITLAIELEELGLCPPGTAGEFVRAGGVALDGPLPVNPHGGLLSHSHCGGAAGIHHVVEAVRQLRGAAEQSVPGARRALLHAEGGILSANHTVILHG